MLIGYARVSTVDQKLDLQNDALTKAGCERIFTDTAGGAGAERTGLEQALGFARKGDTLVVWKLDRLGRSAPPPRRDARRSSGSGDRLPQPPGEHRHDHQRRQAGLPRLCRPGRVRAGSHPRADQGRARRGRARGKKGGRRPKLDDKKRAQALILHHDKSNTIDDICRTLRVGRSTLYRCLAEEKRQ